MLNGEYWMLNRLANGASERGNNDDIYGFGGTHKNAASDSQTNAAKETRDKWSSCRKEKLKL